MSVVPPLLLGKQATTVPELVFPLASEWRVTHYHRITMKKEKEKKTNKQTSKGALTS